jgi:hypothetical protein
MTILEGTEDTITPDNGAAARARPALIENEVVPKRRGRPPKIKVEGVESKSKQTRKRPTAENIAQLKAWKAEGRTLAEMHELSGFSVGSVRKYTADASATPAKRGRPAKVKAAVQAAPKKRGRPAKVATVAAAPAARVDTVTQVKAMLFDLLAAGHPIAAIRGALASFPV